MKAAVYEGPESIVMREVPVPEAKPGWALIKVSYCGICGTDLNIYAGSHPRAKPQLVVGHEFSGTIVTHRTLPAGTPVTVRPLLSCGTCEPCRSGNAHVCETLRLLGIDRAGGMAEYVLAPEDEVYPLPPGMSLRRAALIEPFAVAVHAVRESGFKPGDRVAVFGAGPIGLCTAIALQLYGASRVKVIEVQPFRKRLAESLGLEVVHPEANGPDDRPSDMVFDCAAHPSVAGQLVQAVKVRGRIILVGTYKYPAALDLQNITFKEVQVMGTRVYTRQDYDIAISLLNRQFDFERMITQEFPVESADEAFRLLASGGDSVKVMISLQEDGTK
jgi:2-desacetyl-2-hydroxyethyl bacteriochlorophyllide A dehydrogenase